MERVSCIGYTIGHIASLTRAGQFIGRLRGTGSCLFPGSGAFVQRYLRTARLQDRSHPPADVMALRKYLGGRIADAAICGTDSFCLCGWLLCREAGGDVVCGGRRDLWLCLPDGRLILGVVCRVSNAGMISGL